MDFHFSIEKKHLYIFLVVFALLIGVLGVNAFSESFAGSTTDARTLGHSADEIVVEIDGIEYTLQNLMNVIDDRIEEQTSLQNSTNCGVSDTPDYFNGLSYDACDQGPNTFHEAFADCKLRGGQLPPWHSLFTRGNSDGRSLWDGQNRRYWTEDNIFTYVSTVSGINSDGHYISGSYDDRSPYEVDNTYWRCIGR